MTRARFIVACVLLLAAPLLGGCAVFQRQPSGTRIEAPHSKAELYGALHQAERMLGRTHRGGTIKVRFHEGDTRTHWGWKGRQVPTGIKGGHTTSQQRVLLYLTDGQLHAHNAEHEMAHTILFSHNIPANQHHNIMHAHGFRW